jgi:hypothetical protein
MRRAEPLVRKVRALGIVIPFRRRSERRNVAHTIACAFRIANSRAARLPLSMTREKASAILLRRIVEQATQGTSDVGSLFDDALTHLQMLQDGGARHEGANE